MVSTAVVHTFGMHSAASGRFTGFGPLLNEHPSDLEYGVYAAAFHIGRSS
jgi:hypothetical protein